MDAIRIYSPFYIFKFIKPSCMAEEDKHKGTNIHRMDLLFNFFLLAIEASRLKCWMLQVSMFVLTVK